MNRTIEAQTKTGDIASAVNSYGLKAEEMANDQFENNRKEMHDITLAWIALAERIPEWMIDPRNELSVLLNTLFSKNLC